MIGVLNEIKILIIFSLFNFKAFSQNSITKDTAKSFIICQSFLSYPSIAEENNISGTVVVLFDIDSSCKLVNIRIEKGIGYGCDEEAIKALKNCKPIYEGIKRSCTPQFNLRQPFTFKPLTED